jgi:hypothetical protein
MSIIFLYCINTNPLSSGVISSEDYKSINIHVDELFNDFINLFIDQKSNFEVNDILYNKKVYQLNFEDTIKLYDAARKSRTKKYIINALEHMYVTAPDAKIAELILFKLGCTYIFYRKYESGLLAFAQFKALFPGSKYYNESLKKEIECASKLCLSIYHDSTMAQKLITLLNLYDEQNELINQHELINLYHKGYSIIVGKHLFYLNHYIDKYLYTFDYSTVYASLLELYTLQNELENIFDLPHNFKGKHIFENLYEDVLTFFENHPIVIPEGKDFIPLKKDLETYIEKNYKLIRNDIKKILRNYNKTFGI